MLGTSLVVQWLRLHASTAEGTGSIPGGRNKISHATRHDQKKKKKDAGNSDILLLCLIYKLKFVIGMHV